MKDRVKLLQDAGIDRERSTGVSEATSFNATGRQCYFLLSVEIIEMITTWGSVRMCEL